jgi:hypothetical protein
MITNSVSISGHSVLFINGFFEAIKWGETCTDQDIVLFKTQSAKEMADWCFNNAKPLETKISYSDHSWFPEDFEGLNFDDV